MTNDKCCILPCKLMSLYSQILLFRCKSEQLHGVLALLVYLKDNFLYRLKKNSLDDRKNFVS